jgi:hypothetical protein
MPGVRRRVRSFMMAALSRITQVQLSPRGRWMTYAYHEMIGDVRKATNADRVVFTRQTLERFPDFWVADASFRLPRPRPPLRRAAYFDHYLKGEPAPAWMVEGVSFLERGRERSRE